MRSYDLTHLTNAQLLHDLNRLVVEDRQRTAILLAHLAEVDERRLYVPAGFSSMHAYCVERLGFSDDAAYNRIHAARAARRFPALYEAVADGTLHVTGVRLIAPHLTPETYAELVEAAAHRSKDEIKRHLARRFPQTFAPAPAVFVPGTPIRAARIEPLIPERVPGTPSRVDALVPERVPVELFPEVDPPAEGSEPVSPDRESAPANVEGTQPADQFRLHVTIEGATYDKLRYAQQLLAHAVPSGAVGAVLDRALDVLIEQLEKKKFGAAGAQRRKSRPAIAKRTIPLDVRRRVRERDGKQCTFVATDGTRCSARRLLEFDHAVPVAHGGGATFENLRLRCRAHNQHEAEKMFGPRFMRERRRAARASTPRDPAKRGPSETVGAPPDAT